MPARRLAALLALTALALATAACAGVKPLDYQPINERAGPGLISGPSGKFVVYGGG